VGLNKNSVRRQILWRSTVNTEWNDFTRSSFDEVFARRSFSIDLYPFSIFEVREISHRGDSGACSSDHVVTPCSSVGGPIVSGKSVVAWGEPVNTTRAGRSRFLFVLFGSFRTNRANHLIFAVLHYW